MARTQTNSWPEERIERLKGLWGDPGKPSAATCAAELGITRNAVVGMVNRLGLAKRARDYETAAWTQEDVDLLKTLYDAPERYSQKVMGIRLGKSRSAVSSKIKQLGLPDREPAEKRLSTKITSDGQIIQFPMRRQSNAQLFEKRYPAPAVDVTPLHIDFSELTESTCKFECSEQNEGEEDVRLFTFCGNPTVKDRPYCAGHCRVAFQPVPVRKPTPEHFELGRARGGIFGRMA